VSCWLVVMHTYLYYCPSGSFQGGDAAPIVKNLPERTGTAIPFCGWHCEQFSDQKSTRLRDIALYDLEICPGLKPDSDAHFRLARQFSHCSCFTKRPLLLLVVIGTLPVISVVIRSSPTMFLTRFSGRRQSPLCGLAVPASLRPLRGCWTGLAEVRIAAFDPHGPTSTRADHRSQPLRIEWSSSTLPCRLRCSEWLMLDRLADSRSVVVGSY